MDCIHFATAARPCRLSYVQCGASLNLFVQNAAYERLSGAHNFSIIANRLPDSDKEIDGDSKSKVGQVTVLHPRYLQTTKGYPEFLSVVERAFGVLVANGVSGTAMGPSPPSPTSTSESYTSLLMKDIDSEYLQHVDEIEEQLAWKGKGPSEEVGDSEPPKKALLTSVEESQISKAASGSAVNRERDSFRGDTNAGLNVLRAAHDLAYERYNKANKLAAVFRNMYQGHGISLSQRLPQDVEDMIKSLQSQASDALSCLELLESEIQEHELAESRLHGMQGSFIFPSPMHLGAQSESSDKGTR